MKTSVPFCCLAFKHICFRKLFLEERNKQPGNWGRLRVAKRCGFDKLFSWF